MTKVVASISFTRKEYARVLEEYIDEVFSSTYDLVEKGLESQGFIGIIDETGHELILSYTGESTNRRYFIFPAKVNPVQSAKAEDLERILEWMWLDSWPTAEQIDVHKRRYIKPSGPIDYIYENNDSGNCSVLTDAGTKKDFNNPAYPVRVINIDLTDLFSVLLFLAGKKYTIKGGERFKFVDGFEKYMDSSTRKSCVPTEDLPNIPVPEWLDKLVKEDLVNSLGLKKDFTPNDIKYYLKSSDYYRAEIPPYDEGYFLNETEWLWELYPEQDCFCEVGIPSGATIRARDPRDDIKNSVIAVDFGTSSTVVVEYDPNHPDAPRQICVGNLENYENPTLMLVKNYDGFLSSYYRKDCRPYTKWDDLMVSHAVKGRLGDAQNNEFKAIVSHIKQWAADDNANLIIKPVGENDPICVKPLSELCKQENSEEFNPIEIYAYFLGLYLNNRHSGYGIYLKYQLSYPATYSEDVRNWILSSFKKGIRKSIPSAIADDEIKVEMKISEPEAYAITAMQKYGFEPEGNEKIKFGIFDFGGGTSDFAYGYWSEPDKKGKERKIETIEINGEQYLGGENILDSLAFEVFSCEKNLEVLDKRRCKFTYGIKKWDKKKGVDDRYLSDNFFAKNNMATLINWRGAQGEEVDANGFFGCGLRVFWENQDKYFPEYLSDTTMSPEMLSLIHRIKDLLVHMINEKGRADLEGLLKRAEGFNNDFDRSTIESALSHIQKQYASELPNEPPLGQDEYKIQPTLYNADGGTESNVEIIVSKSLMYKFFVARIEEGINSFFSALKTAFEEKNDYKGNIYIFLAGNASKSPILRKLMEDRIKKENTEGVTFTLLERFDSDDYEDSLRKVLKQQGWAEEDIDAKVNYERGKENKYQPTGKTGVAFGIVEMAKGKIQVEQKMQQDFKYYLGDEKSIKGMPRFQPFEGFGKKKPQIGGRWIETFKVDPSNEPVEVTLYYTTKAECVDGKMLISHASTCHLTIPPVGENDKVYMKAASVNSIYYVVADSEAEADKIIGEPGIDLAEYTATLT